MENWSNAPPSVQRHTELLVRLINATKYVRDDVLDLVNAYTSMYDKARGFQCLYITERVEKERLEAENAFLTQLVNKYESDE